MSARAPRHVVPEVVQTSGMDCGPACLTALAAGFGVHVSYGRLREACQTDVDGTSIDTLEEIAVKIGLDACQVMIPVDHLLLEEARALPAIVVVRLPNGFTHFVVAWRCHFEKVVQVMDPASGRRWPSVRRFLEEVYVHRQRVSAEAWREWAWTDDFQAPLRCRLVRLGLGTEAAGELVAGAARDPGWRSLAALDAAARKVEELAASGALARGGETVRLVRGLVNDQAPDDDWSVRPPADGDEGELEYRAAVLVRVRGATEREASEELPRELEAALREPPVRPWRELRRLLAEDGSWRLGALAAALALAATGVVVEALLFRGLLDLGSQLATPEQRLGLMAALVVFVAANRALAFLTHGDALGFGRRLEGRLRRAFLAKLPRLGDRYFRSRPVSDMAERAHSLHQLRELAEIGRTFCRYAFETLLAAAGMLWIYPGGAVPVVLTVAVSLAVPFVVRPALAERDLRVRTHLGALARTYLDALIGLVAVRTHAAERTLRREHEALLGEWAKSKLGWIRLLIASEGVQLVVGTACVVGIVFGYLRGGAETGGLLLLVYWGIYLPFRSRQVIYAAMDYARQRNVLLRVLEPLGAPEPEAPATVGEEPTRAGGVEVVCQGVGVVAAGHRILDGVDLRVAAGEHVAVVGPSGAGKTTFVGLLLGWHRPAEGRLEVDGEPLDAAALERLRRATAWVDPAVQLWNRTLYENLRYGNGPAASRPWGSIVDRAELQGVLERLPDGFQTSLGEGGGLVSGGEGQRVRLGRAMARPGVRLAILDEPFRGLGREQRASLLASARELWAEATLFCITHDVAETRRFPRVLVIEDGRLVEDGDPAELEARPGSRYAALLAAERRVKALWRTSEWRQLRLEDGRIAEGAAGEGAR